MKMTSLKINGRTVSRLSINGREVALGSTASDALCFTADEAGSTVQLTKEGYPVDVNLQTSTDGNSWNPYTVEDTITLTNVGDKVYFKAVGSNYSIGNGQSAYHKFIMTGKIASSGNLNSLLEEDEEVARTMSLAGKDYCYYNLFLGCTSLTTAPELPATTLANNCYSDMFYGCTSLTTAPELPATTLAESCYGDMFQNCESLTKAPALPATTLTYYCYYQMFDGCTSLTQAPELPAGDLIESCYAYMFQGCTSLNYVSVGFGNWVQYATDNWLPENTGTFVCRSTLINNTTERSTSTVPATWTMTV